MKNLYDFSAFYFVSEMVQDKNTVTGEQL